MPANPNFPPLQDKIEYVGPFKQTHVVINGRLVPYLTAHTMGPTVSLTLDGRLGLDIPVELSDAIVAFIADCIAVGMGYASFPRYGIVPPMPRPDFPMITEITSAETSADGNTHSAQTEDE